jgi:cytochrome c oxidase cbb3-type subunit 4
MELVRSLVTLAAFLSFLGIVWWAYSPSRKDRLESVSRSILEDDER